MTAKPKRGFQGFGWGVDFELTAQTKKELRGYMGTEAPDELFSGIERAITNYCSWRDHAEQKPGDPEIDAMLKSITTKTKALEKDIKDIDAYSKALIGAIRVNDTWTFGHPVEEFEKSLIWFMYALDTANRKRAKEKRANYQNGRPTLAGRRGRLSADVQDLLKHFKIDLPAQVFDDCFRIILESAGEPRELDTVSKLGRNSRRALKK
jgi:hypothetical protein